MNLASSLNSVPEQLHEDDGPVDEVHLLLEQDEVVYLGLVRPSCVYALIGVTFKPRRAFRLKKSVSVAPAEIF